MSAVSSIGSGASAAPAGQVGKGASVAEAGVSSGSATGGNAAAAATSQNSARNVMVNSQATSVLNTFQSALAGEDMLKLIMAMLVLEALSGGEKEKDEDKSLAALALLGAAAGSGAGGSFLSSYASIQQVDSSAASNANEQLYASGGYVTGSQGCQAGSALNVLG